MNPTFIDRALGSDIPYITYAVPFFFLLIGVELVVALWQRQRYYRLHDAINDLSCGSTEQIISIFLKGVLFAGYQGTYAFATARKGSTWSTSTPTRRAASGPRRSCCSWASTGLLLVPPDRARVQRPLGRARRAPLERGLQPRRGAAAERVPEGLFSWVFYLPLALLGFPPSWFAAIMSFNLLYQFWIHTRTIKTLGPLEWVLNTPSHHRVHHARNPKYLDRNYAGTLIIWDRMFGTFQAEEEEPVYGLTSRSIAGTRSGPTCTSGATCSATPGWRRDGSTSCGSGSCRRAGGPRDCRGGRRHPR